MTPRIRSLKSLALGALSGALLFGCGGNNSSSNVPADWTAPVPSTLPSNNLTDVDVSLSNGTSVSTASMSVVANAAQADDPCHPHLFQRTYEMADILNNHTHKMMDRIAAIIRHPKALDNSPNCTVDNKSDPTQISCTIDRAAGLFGGYPLTLTWQKSVNTPASGTTQYVTNVYIQPNSVTAAELHQCELGNNPLPSACTLIFSSTLDATPQANGYDVSSPSGTPVHFDFTALHSVDSAELATGTFDVNVEFTKDTTKPNPYRRILGFQFTNFVPWLTAQEMAAGEASHGARTGSLAHVGYSGSIGGAGGAMEFIDEVILFCPQYGSPAAPNSSLYSDALTIGRWYQDTTTNPGTVTLFGRVDAEAVGDAGGATPTGSDLDGSGNWVGNAQLGPNTEYLGGVCYGGGIDTGSGAIAAEDITDPWMFVESDNGSALANSYKCGPETTPGDNTTCVTSCGKGNVFSPLPSVSGTTINNPYSFNGLTTNSTIPTAPADIAKDLEPLLCPTGVGSAWTSCS